MPKRSDRAIFAGSFTDNPFEGLSPEEIYKQLKWGNKPKKIKKVNAPEPLISLGYLAALVFPKSPQIDYDENEINLAIGAYSNFIYLFPVDCYSIPSPKNWIKKAQIKETHYYSDKGGDECYYYHEHEKPYPHYYSHPSGRMGIIVPQNFKGQRSYAVIKEGIVG